MSHTLTSLEFLFTNGGIEVHTHAGPSVLASCVCTSRLNRGGFRGEYQFNSDCLTILLLSEDLCGESGVTTLKSAMGTIHTILIHTPDVLTPYTLKHLNNH